MANIVEVLLKLTKQGTGAQEATRELSGLDRAINVAGGALAAFATVQTARAAYELAELGAQSIRTRDAFTAISGGAEEAAARLEAMRRATRGAISETEMMASANRLMQMGLASNADELERLTAMAVRLGTAMGRDASASIQEFALLLANQSIPRLDTFGISAGRVRQRILDLQAAMPGLSRETAFLQATMEEGEAAMERLGPVTEDAALAFEQLEASVLDLKAAFAEELVPAFVWFIEGITSAPDIMRQVLVIMGFGAERALLMAAALHQNANAANAVQVAVHDFYRGMGLFAGGIETLAGHERDLNAVLRDTVAAAGEGEGAVGDLASAFDALGQAVSDGIPDAEDMWRLVLSMGQAAGRSVDELAAMAQAMGVAEREEVQATLAAYGLAESYANTGERAQDLVAVTQHLQRYHEEMTLATEAAAEGDEELAQAHRDTAQAALDLALQISDTGIAISDTSDAADGLTDSLDRIPREVVIELKGQAEMDRMITRAQTLLGIFERLRSIGPITPAGTGAQMGYGELQAPFSGEPSHGYEYLGELDAGELVPILPGGGATRAFIDSRTYGGSTTVVNVSDPLTARLVLNMATAEVRRDIAEM